MDSLAEAKVKDMLQHWLHYGPYDCGTVVEQMTAVARTAGFDLDARFAGAGLGAGPEAQVASRILARALLEGGDETSDYAMRKEIEKWLREHPRKGR
jgi:hypothetical protein